MSNNIPPQPETPPQPIEAPTSPSSAPAKRRPGPLAAGLIGLAIGAGTIGAIWAITANSGFGKPATFTLEGAFALTDDVVSDGDDGCKGAYDSGYDDIAEGTSITVYGADGEVIATGSLGDSDQRGTICTFDVAIEDVPKGEKFYKVEVSHRGTVKLTAEQAENGELVASLG